MLRWFLTLLVANSVNLSKSIVPWICFSYDDHIRLVGKSHVTNYTLISCRWLDVLEIYFGWSWFHIFHLPNCVCRWEFPESCYFRKLLSPIQLLFYPRWESVPQGLPISRIWDAPKMLFPARASYISSVRWQIPTKVAISWTTRGSRGICRFF